MRKYILFVAYMSAKICAIKLVFQALALTPVHFLRPTWTLSSYSALKTTPRSTKVGLHEIREKIVLLTGNIWLAAFSPKKKKKTDFGIV